MPTTPTSAIVDPFDLMLNKVGVIKERTTSGYGGYGGTPSLSTVGATAKCRYATLASVPTDIEFRSKSKEAIAFRKVFLRPWFVDQSPDGSYEPSHVIGPDTYNTQPLRPTHWLLIENEMYDIYELRNPGGLYHHFEACCRVIEV